MLKKRKIIFWTLIPLLLLGTWWLVKKEKSGSSAITAPVKRGKFIIQVFTTGELEAKNSIDINGPSSTRLVGIWQMKISNLVAEGTIVQKGDYIAELDKTEIAGKIKDAESELQKIESQYTQVKLDTTLQLRQARDDISSLEFMLKEKEIIIEQSQFEPPATIRQLKLELEKSERALEQAKQNYKVKENQAQARMQEVSASLTQTKDRLQKLYDVLNEFTIRAPEAGMVIYKKEWDGRKKTVGSSINGWDPTVATLPDLSIMISKTYVNEVDIQKVKTNQKVIVSLDAFPEKKYSGKVISVANVGEQHPKSDAKVFEVTVQLNETDTTLRPSMTTGNNIIVQELENKLYAPLESIHSEGDSLTYVYVKNSLSLIKKEIKIGQTNEDHAIILEGLQEKEEVYLSSPENAQNLSLIRLSAK